MVTIVIDPNVRIGKNLTYASESDADGHVRQGDHVTVREAETGAEGPAVVIGKGGLDTIFLKVDWAHFGWDKMVIDDA